MTDHSNTNVPSSSGSEYEYETDGKEAVNFHKAHKALDMIDASGSRRKHSKHVVKARVSRDGSGGGKDSDHLSQTEGKSLQIVLSSFFI